MKKILLFIAAVLLFSCVKEEEFCWDCAVTTATTTSTGTVYDTDMQEKCGMTQREAHVFELPKTTGNFTRTAECSLH